MYEGWEPTYWHRTMKKVEQKYTFFELDEKFREYIIERLELVIDSADVIDYIVENDEEKTIKEWVIWVELILSNEGKLEEEEEENIRQLEESMIDLYNFLHMRGFW